MYANIIVDISHEQLDKTFQYHVPDALLSQMMTENMMNMLTSNQRELVYALYFEHQTFQEYAEVHGISSAAVNNRRKKALARLSASLIADSER